MKTRERSYEKVVLGSLSVAFQELAMVGYYLRRAMKPRLVSSSSTADSTGHIQSQEPAMARCGDLRGSEWQT